MFKEFLLFNKTLQILDMSKNLFTDYGFQDFVEGFSQNEGIQDLNISKNKDITDDIGLREISNALYAN